MKNIIFLFFFIFFLSEERLKAENKQNITEIKIKQSYNPIAIFKKWFVFKVIKDKKTHCYTIATPQKKDGTYNVRGEPFFMVIGKEHSGKNEMEIHGSSGYMFHGTDPNSEIDIMKKKFPLLAIDDKYWAYNPFDDKNIIVELNKAPFFNIMGFSKDQEYSLDIYSLDGFSEAYEKVLELCDIE